VRVENGRLLVRNHIYARVFDKRWAEENMPDAALRRERAAFRRGVLTAVAIAALVLAVMGLLGWEAVRQAGIAHAREVRARGLLYAADMNLAQTALGRQDIGTAMVLLQAHRVDPNRSFDWAWLMARSNEHDGQEIPLKHGVQSVAYSPDSSMIAAGGDDGSLDVWSVGSLKRTRMHRRLSSCVIAVAFESRFKIVTLTIDGDVSIWNLNTEECINQWKVASSYISGLAITSKGGVMAISGSHGVLLFDGRGKVLRSFSPGAGVLCTSAAISGNGQFVATGCDDNTARLWDTRSGHQVVVRHAAPVNAVGISNDNRLFATASDDSTARIWAVATGYEIASLAHGGAVYSAAFSHDSRSLATGSFDQTVRVWNVANSEHATVFDGHMNGVKSVAFRPGDSELVSGGVDNRVVIWKVRSSIGIQSLKGPIYHLARYSLSRDGHLLVTWDSQNGIVDVWDTTTLLPLHHFMLAASSIGSAIFTNDDQFLFIADKKYGIQVYSTSSWHRINSHPAYGLPISHPIAISLDDRLIVARSTVDPTRAEIWMIAKRKQIGVLPGDGKMVLAAALSSDNKIVAIAGHGETVTLWDAATMRLVGRLSGSKTVIEAVAMTPDDREVLSGGDDGSISFWKLAEMRQTITIPGLDKVTSLAFSRDRRTLKVTTAAGNIRFWKTANN